VNDGYSWDQLQLTNEDSDIIAACEGEFLGDFAGAEDLEFYDKYVQQKYLKSGLPLFKPVPDSFKIISAKYFISVHDSAGDLVAVKFCAGTKLLPVAREQIRSLMEQLLAGHADIAQGKRKEAFASEMSAFGPRYDHKKKGGQNKVSFYTYDDIKLTKLFSHVNSMIEFSDIVDKFCHLELAKIVFSLYLWLCSIVLTSFVEFSMPFLSEVDYTPLDLEVEVELPPPFAY
jgi:hypothetical protein